LDKIEPNFLQDPKPHEAGFSTDWSKYATPQFTLDHLREPNLPANGVVEMNVGDLLQCIAENNFPLSIPHDPIREATTMQGTNRAHTLVLGITKANKAKIRRKLSKIIRWVENFKPHTN